MSMPESITGDPALENTMMTEGGGGSGPNVMKLSKKQMLKLSHRIGKRLLVEEKFLDDLADALDGEDLNGELSETDSDESSEEESEDDATPTSKQISEMQSRAASKQSSNDAAQKSVVALSSSV